MQKIVSVVPYDPAWAQQFLDIKNTIWPLIADFAISIEHVGSTSIVGLAAKPVIDIDIIIPDMTFLENTIQQLATLGYDHRGDLGIEDRHAFRAKQAQVKHNLYVCPQNSIALKNHLSLRDALRANSALRDEYSVLKQELAVKYRDNIDQYVEGKTDFILKILAENGLSSERLAEIREANLAPQK
jgi:GrpB-like predicted nucleotidyltransferase (UPF0157 family)